MLRFRPEQTEERWSEQHAGDHLRYDLRLAKAQSDRADEPAEQKNDRELKKKLDGKMQVGHGQLTYATSTVSGIRLNPTRSTLLSHRFCDSAANQLRT